MISISSSRSAGPTFDEPLEMLAACHGKIETQLDTLERLVEHLVAKGCDTDAQGAARAVLRYFDTSGAYHHRDEDEDLFPLLRMCASEHGRMEVAAVMDELEREHATMDVQWSRLRARLADLAAGRDARLDVEDVTRFAWLYRRHMDREAMVVFPYAAEALEAQDRSALGERMAARRKIEYQPAGEKKK